MAVTITLWDMLVCHAAGRPCDDCEDPGTLRRCVALSLAVVLHNKLTVQELSSGGQSNRTLSLTLNSDRHRLPA